MSAPSVNVYVLLIGINAYNNPNISDLRGGLENVRMLKKLFSDAFATTATTTMIVLTSPMDPSLSSIGLPERSNVQNAFGMIIQQATSNDLVYVYFSGHGARPATLWPHLKPDTFDEALCLMPTNGMVDVIRDVEVAWYLKRMSDKGAAVTVLLDSCHAGGALRSSNAPAQGEHPPQMTYANLDPDSILPRDPLIDVPATQDFWHPAAPDDSRSAKALTHWLTHTRGVEFFAACQQQEISYQVWTGSSMAGHFTQGFVTAATRHSTSLYHMSCDMVFKAAREEFS